jgi:hypothetical protein
MFKEGQKVAYTGLDIDGLSLGVEGKVLVLSPGAAHVSFTNGTIAAIPFYDLTPLKKSHSVKDELEDSLEMGLTTFAARDVFDMGGEMAVLSAMAESGHLAAFDEIAEDAISMVSNRIRQDVSFKSVLSQLDEEESESVIRYAAVSLIQDIFGEQ